MLKSDSFWFKPFLQVYRFKMGISSYVSLIYITGCVCRGGGGGRISIIVLFRYLCSHTNHFLML